MGRFDERSAIVTGGALGIGGGCARLLDWRCQQICAFARVGCASCPFVRAVRVRDGMLGREDGNMPRLGYHNDVVLDECSVGVAGQGELEHPIEPRRLTSVASVPGWELGIGYLTVVGGCLG